MSIGTPQYTSSPILSSKGQNSSKTLTGIVLVLESSMDVLIRSKKKDKSVSFIDEKLQMKMLEKMYDEICLLKCLLTNRVSKLLESMNCDIKHKSNFPTNNTDSGSKRIAQEVFNNTQAISDFDLGNYKINSLQTRRQNMAYHQKIYPDESIKSEQKVISMEARRNGYKDNIKIVEEQVNFDLNCYEDEKTISDRNDSFRFTFSPIKERPLQEQYSVEKSQAFQQIQLLKEITNTKRVLFDPKKDNFYSDLLRQKQEMKNGLFNHQCHCFKRVHHRKYNYLQQAQKY